MRLVCTISLEELVTPLPVDLRETLALLKPVAASSQQHYEEL